MEDKLRMTSQGSEYRNPYAALQATLAEFIWKYALTNWRLSKRSFLCQVTVPILVVILRTIACKRLWPSIPL